MHLNASTVISAFSQAVQSCRQTPDTEAFQTPTSCVFMYFEGGVALGTF